MADERDRKLRPHVLLTHRELLSGEFKCPFTGKELELLEIVRDGRASNGLDAEIMGIMPKSTFESRRSKISEKIDNIYSRGGSDRLAKALSIAIIGGWIDDESVRHLGADLSPIEFSVLLQRCFGYGFWEISRHSTFRNLFMSSRTLGKMFAGIKEKLGVKSDLQAVAWGASKAKKWISENPEHVERFFSQ